MSIYRQKYITVWVKISYVKLYMYIYKYIYVCEKRIYEYIYADIIKYKHIMDKRSSHAPFIKCLRRFSLQKVQIPIKYISLFLWRIRPSWQMGPHMMVAKTFLDSIKQWPIVTFCIVESIDTLYFIITKLKWFQ